MGSTGQVLQSQGNAALPAYSTATYPATAGTSGNVLTSDGTNWTSATAPGGGMLLASLTLTNAQIKALHGTPIQLVAAPGANKVILPISMSCKFIYGGTNVFVAGAAQSIGLYYNNTTTPAIFTSNVASNAMIVSNANKFAFSANVSDLLNQTVGVIDNVNVALYNPIATEITGNAANNNTISFQLVYWIASL